MVEKEESKSKATPNAIKSWKGFLMYRRTQTLGHQHHVSRAGWDVPKGDLLLVLRHCPQASERPQQGTCPCWQLCLSVAALLPQSLDVGRHAGQAVYPLHHAMLLDELGAALEDLGD